VLASLLLIAALGASPVAGEISTPAVTVQYTERARGAARPVLDQVEVAQAAFQRVLGQRWPRRITVRLGAGRAELEALALEGGKPPGWAAALAYPEKDTMLLDALTLGGPQGGATVRHELMHLALGQLGSFPHWFHEGFAVLLSDEGFDVGYYAAMYRGVRTGRIASFEDLAGGFPEHRSEAEVAYAQSASFASFLADRHGPAAFDELFQRVRAGERFETAFAKAFHASIGSEEGDWRRTLERKYGTIPLATLISLLWSATALLCVAAFLRRRAQKLRNLKRMDEEAALEALLRAAASPEEDEGPDPPPVLH